MSGRVLEVVRGDPTAEELAAVVCLLLAPAPPPAAPLGSRPLWAVPALRRPLAAPGPDAWRRSALPR